MSRLPLIGIPADRRLLRKHYFHMVGEKYIEAVAAGANALPVLVPALGPGLDLQSLLDSCDGLLLTGSESNVEPHHYGGPASAPGTLHDPNRDATTLPLIPQAVAAGLPVLAICRGFQEMNVAYGGTLYQRLHEVEGFSDHREDESTELDVQYGPAHEVLLEPGGTLQKIAGRDRLQVNSLHWQGVQTLGSDLHGGGARAGRRHRGVPGRRCAELRARRAMASRMAVRNESIFPRAVRRIRSGQSTACNRLKVIYG